MNEHCLIGKIISEIKIAADKQAILFVTNQGEIIANVDGDCCSVTWIEHIELPAMGFPAKVYYAENLNMPDLGSPNEYDVITYYGFKITTDKGVIVIDYRNESNGYYGGDLVWPGEYFYGGVSGQNISDQQWRDISN